MRLSGWLKSTKLRRWHVSRNGSFTYLHPLAFAAAPSPFAPGTFPLLLYIPVTDINSFVSVVWRSAVAGSRCCYFHKLLLLTFFYRSPSDAETYPFLLCIRFTGSFLNVALQYPVILPLLMSALVRYFRYFYILKFLTFFFSLSLFYSHSSDVLNLNLDSRLILHYCYFSVTGVRSRYPWDISYTSIHSRY